MTKQEWNNGIPPVGEKCSMKKGLFISTVIYHGQASDGRSIIECSKGTVDAVRDVEFEPIQSQQDKERYKAILDVRDEFLAELSCDPPRYEQIALLVDAGYHNGPKVRELSDEEILALDPNMIGIDPYAAAMRRGAYLAVKAMLGKDNG